MPHPLSVKLLSEICVDFIKDNMSKFCEMSSMMRPAGVDAFNAVNSQSPFDSLRKFNDSFIQFIAWQMNYWFLYFVCDVSSASVILEGIIRHLTLSNQLKEKYLELLITPHLRTLDFSMCDKHSISGLLRLASRKCPVMTKFFFKNIKAFKISYLYNSTWDLYGLEVLDTSWAAWILFQSLHICKCWTSQGLEQLTVYCIFSELIVQI